MLLLQGHLVPLLLDHLLHLDRVDRGITPLLDRFDNLLIESLVPYVHYRRRRGLELCLQQRQLLFQDSFLLL